MVESLRVTCSLLADPQLATRGLEMLLDACIDTYTHVKRVRRGRKVREIRSSQRSWREVQVVKKVATHSPHRRQQHPHVPAGASLRVAEEVEAVVSMIDSLAFRSASRSIASLLSDNFIDTWKKS